MPTINETPYYRFATQLNGEIIKPLEKTLVARKLAVINPMFRGDGMLNLETTKVGKLSDAFIQYNLPSGTGEHKDSLTSTQDIVRVPVIYKEFEIPKQDVLVWENRKVAPGAANTIDSMTAQAATREVAKQEETIMFLGWNPSGSGGDKIPGYWTVANNKVTGGDVGTTGNAYEYITAAMGELMADDIVGESAAFNVTLSPSTYSKLNKSVYANSGEREIEMVRKALNGGNIFVSSLMTGVDTTNTANGAIVTPVDTAREHFEILNPVDIRVEFANPKYASLSPIEGTVYELIRPYFKRTEANKKCNAVCIIDNLS